MFRLIVLVLHLPLNPTTTAGAFWALMPRPFLCGQGEKTLIPQPRFAIFTYAIVLYLFIIIQIILMIFSVIDVDERYKHTHTLYGSVQEI